MLKSERGDKEADRLRTAAERHTFFLRTFAPTPGKSTPTSQNNSTCKKKIIAALLFCSTATTLAKKYSCMFTPVAWRWSPPPDPWCSVRCPRT